MRMKIFIDTNWFLSFYQSNHERRQVLRDVVAKADLIVVTEQNITEFRRNRSALLTDLRNKIFKSTQITPYTTSLIVDMEEHNQMLELAKKLKKSTEALVSKLEEIENGISEEDEILGCFNELITKCTVIPVLNEDIEKAQRRKLRGIPPSSNKRDTLGDELIWECLLRGCDHDLAIVSLDGDFTRQQDSLRSEFSAHHSHRKIVYCGNKMSEALKEFGLLTPEEYDDLWSEDPSFRCEQCGGSDWQRAGRSEDDETSRYICGQCRNFIHVY